MMFSDKERIKRLESELAETKAILNAKEEVFNEQCRLAQMGEMIAMIAHQWRQPLGVISSISAGIEMQVELEHEINNKELLLRLTEINKQVSHLSSTIDDFRNFFKPNKHSTIVDINELVMNTLDIIEHDLKNNDIDVLCEMNSVSRVAVFDNEVKQVLLALMKNGQEAIKENFESGVIKIVTYDKRGSSFIEIHDTGGGIKAEKIKQIFKPYYSTKAKNGTGLGLYMSKVIVEEHCNGKLTAFNDEKGAVFVLAFTSES